VIIFLVGLVGVAALLFFFLRGTDKPDSLAELPQVEEAFGLYVSGVVIDGTGKGVPGALVRSGEDQATTDDTGAFKFPELEPGNLSIGAEADGYVTKGPPGRPLWTGELKARHALAGLKLVLHQAGVASGVIVAGRTAVSAHLTVLYRDAGAGEYSVEAGSSDPKTGAFSIDGLAPGQIRLLVEAEGYAFAESEEFLLSDGETLSEIVIDLSPGGVVMGVVSDPAGTPLSGAELVLQGSGRARKIVSESDGSFSFAAVPVGEVSIRARLNGFLDSSVDGLVIVANETSNTDIVLERTTGVFGRVFDKAGPVTPAFIILPGARRPELVVSDGSFKVLVPGVSELTVISPRHIPKTVAIVPGVSSEIELTQGGSARGSVVDESGNPVPQAQVSVNWFQADGPTPYGPTIYPVQSVNGSDGSFEIGPLRPGKYTLSARSGANATGESKTFEIRDSRAVTGIRIVLPAGAIVEGVVRDSAGNPVPRARVELFEAFSRFAKPSTLTGADGTYRIDGVPPGRRSLRVSARGFMTRLASGIEVKAGTNTRDVSLAPEESGKKFSFGGIGAVLSQTADGIIVQKTMEGKPAALYGLQPGDLIRGIDGEDTADTRLDRVVEKLRGEEGAPVTVEVERGGKRMKVEITRGSVEVK
jgi:hypothetical protein